MIYIPLWLKLSLTSMETEGLAWMQGCSFCAVYQGPDAKRRGVCFSWAVKKFPKLHKQKGSLGYYTALQGVGSYWKSFTVYILLYWLVTQRKKEHCKLSDMHGNEHFVSECSCHGLFFFCKKESKKREYARHKIRNPIMEIRVMNPQQGHIIMQWPSQAHLHRWVELVSLDHKSTHGRFEPVTDIIQQDGWISESQVTFTNLPDRKKITLPFIPELPLCYLWPVDYLCCLQCSGNQYLHQTIITDASHSCPKRTLQIKRYTWRPWHVWFSHLFHS